MAQFRLIMHSGPAAGNVFPLEAEEITIGRDVANSIVINEAEVSRRHARMELRGSAYLLQDLGSTNGTFVNGKRLSGMQVLNSGDTITFGEGVLLIYEREAAPDINATVATARPPQPVIQTPQPLPAVVPPPSPAAGSAYPRQVPAVPMPGGSVPQALSSSAQAPVTGKGHRTLIIIAIAAVMLVLVLCVGVLYVADRLYLDCLSPFRFFFNIIGPIFGYGVCP